MKTKTFILIIAALLVFPVVILAETIRPTKAFIYFNEDNNPYSQPVDFTINCYNAEKADVFSFSANCPSYGCEILGDFDAGNKDISYCDLTVKAEGRESKIEKYAESPVFGCTNLTPYDFSLCDENGCKYIKEGKLVKEAESDEELRQKEPEFFIGRECNMTFNIQKDSSEEELSRPDKKGFFESIFDFIRCFFKRLFGKNC